VTPQEDDAEGQQKDVAHTDQQIGERLSGQHRREVREAV